MKHGLVSENGHVRYCDAHREHGPLYPCPEYSEATLEEISQSSAKLRVCLHDPEWIKRHNISPEVLAIFRWFAGV
jgi:hypothetical protein